MQERSSKKTKDINVIAPRIVDVATMKLALLRTLLL
jgi:hypothetical protein